MNPTLRTILVLVGAAIALVALLANFPILGVAAFCALGVLIASGSKWGKDRRQSLLLSEHLSPESRLMLRPVRRLAAFNREIVRKQEQRFSVIDDALIETENVVRQCIRWLEVRDRLVDMQRGQRASQIQLAHLKWRLETAYSDEERIKLETALAEQQTEVDHFFRIQKQIEIIDTRVKHAEYALDHLKMVLTMNSMDAKPQEDHLLTLGRGGSGMTAGG